MKRSLPRWFFNYSALIVIVFFILISLPADAEDLAVINRPVNSSGLTGLLFTTAPYTLNPSTVEAAAAVISENSIKPDYTLTAYPVSVSAGLPNNVEVVIQDTYYNLQEGPTTTAVTQRKIGELGISCKWNFLPQSESSIRPALSLIIGGLIPTEQSINRKIDTLQHWGVHIGLAAGTEISWGDHVLGLYADGQVHGSDPSEERLRDIYGTLNAGLLFPVSKHQNLQMLFEYNLVSGQDRITVTGGDYTAFTYGMRLVSERFNITIGSQFVHKETIGFDNSGKMIGLMSMKFP